MARYDEKQRKKNATIGTDRYPIGDKAHAKAALARINQGNLTPSQKEIVRSKANKMLGKGRTK